MATTPHPQTPGLDDPIERWGRQNGARGGAADWPGRSTFNEALKSAGIDPLREAPSGMRAGSAPAAARVAPAAAPKYTPPPVDAEGRYKYGGVGNGQTSNSLGVGAAAPNADGVPGSGVGGAVNNSGLRSIEPSGVTPEPKGLWGRTKGLASGAYQGVSRAVSGTYGAAKTVGPGLAAGAAGSYLAGQAREYDPTTGTRGGYAPPSAVNQIPTDGYGPAPAKQAYNYFTDNETGRNIGNLAMATAPLGGMLGSGMRLVPTAGKLIPRLAYGADMVDAATVGAANNIQRGREETAAPTNTASNATNSVAPDYPQANARANVVTLRQGDQGAPGVNPYHGDLTKQLNTAPSDLQSTGMRANDIYRTKQANGTTLYSGFGDGSGTMGSIVNGDGTKRASQGNVSVLPFSGGNVGLRGGQQDFSAPSTPQPQGMTAYERELNAWNEKSHRSSMMADLKRQGLSSRQAAAHIAQIDQTAATREGQRLQADTSLRTTGMNNDVSLRTTGMNNDTNLRATDMNNQVSLRNSRASNMLAMSQAQRDQWNKDREYASGRSDKNFEQASKAVEQGRDAFSGLFDTIGEDGKVIQRKDLEAQALMTARRASGGKWDTLSPTERAEHVGNAHSYVTLLDSARQHQNNGWMQEFGLDAPDAPRGGLPSPEELSNSVLERVGMREGATTPNASRGDYALRLPNGRVMYLGSNISGEHLKYLQNQGVK